jgi:hypothetical protein
MLDSLFERAGELHRGLIEFVKVADGAIGTARAEFESAQLKRSPQLDSAQRQLVNYRFVVEGRLADRSILDAFCASRQDLSDGDRALVSSWQGGFMALLGIIAVYPNGLEVMNWITAKHYRIQFADLESLKAVERLKVGEVILAQIIPIRGIDWLISSPWITLGKLGYPKLAVAIGTFRHNYPHYLYPDAPELLAAAWDSVTAYHDRFVDFFGSDEFTLTGVEMERKMAEFQQHSIDLQLAAAGVDKDKSLAELAADAGGNLEETIELAATLGVPGGEASEFSHSAIGKMVAPSLEFPPHLKQVRQLTALSDPHWGQILSADYAEICGWLADFGTQIDDRSPLPTQIDRWQKFLAQPQSNAFIWRKLAAKYPHQFTAATRQLPDCDNFNLSTDLDNLLIKFNKYREPELPDIASVPLHLHRLFESALKQVSKDKAKVKKTTKSGGFGTKS